MNYFHVVLRIFAALQTLFTLTIYLKIGKKSNCILIETALKILISAYSLLIYFKLKLKNVIFLLIKRIFFISLQAVITTTLCQKDVIVSTLSIIFSNQCWNGQHLFEIVQCRTKRFFIVKVMLTYKRHISLKAKLKQSWNVSSEKMSQRFVHHLVEGIWVLIDVFNILFLHINYWSY